MDWRRKINKIYYLSYSLRTGLLYVVAFEEIGGEEENENESSEWIEGNQKGKYWSELWCEWVFLLLHHFLLIVVELELESSFFRHSLSHSCKYGMKCSWEREKKKSSNFSRNILSPFNIYIFREEGPQFPPCIYLLFLIGSFFLLSPLFILFYFH